MVSHPHEPAMRAHVSSLSATSPICILPFQAFELQIPICKHIRAQYSVCSYFKKVVSLVKAALIKNQLEEFRVFSNRVEGQESVE
ncbi:unnamed protein product [Cuscuta epithymum]|uniref:Uncharacterized protein n=1 Tax=Cuscuta epithymum TaxID=186058 RepID=A0AAV0CD74_9ASTE|nr:unnamed protein product [Cuscuta epithymum]